MSFGEQNTIVVMCSKIVLCGPVEGRNFNGNCFFFKRIALLLHRVN